MAHPFLLGGVARPCAARSGFCPGRLDAPYSDSEPARQRDVPRAFDHQAHCLHPVHTLSTPCPRPFHTLSTPCSHHARTKFTSSSHHAHALFQPGARTPCCREGSPPRAAASSDEKVCGGDGRGCGGRGCGGQVAWGQLQRAAGVVVVVRERFAHPPR